MTIAAAAPLTYGAKEPLSADESALVREALVAGWAEFATIAGVCPSAIEPCETTYARARVGVLREQGEPSAWTTRTGKGAWIFVRYPTLARFSAADRAHVVCHELLHAYYGLPDHHKGAAGGGVKTCAMDNWFRYGWPNGLCDPCRAVVDKALHAR